METLEEIRQSALIEASEIELQWERIDKNPERFGKGLEEVLETLPTIESLYTKLTTGVGVTIPDEPSPLEYERLEEYTILVADELYNMYIMKDLYDRFRAVRAIIM